MGIRTLLIVVVLFLIDLYIFSGVKFLTRNLLPSTARYIYFFYWGITAVCLTIIIAGVIYDWHDWPKALRTYSFAFVFVTYFSKLFLVLFLLIDDIFRLFKWISELIGFKAEKSEPVINDVKPGGIKRSDFIVKLGLLIAAIPFSALIMGMIRGKYAYKVREVSLNFEKLPKSFKGFKIIQISDIHTGSFMNSEPLEKAVRIINDLNADAVFFTGDLVNDLHRELIPFKETLSKIKAKHGVYSILGNHDYGDYYQWENKEKKELNLQSLINAHREMGWNILLDEHRHIERNGEKISVIGVQNWSARGNFARYGSLDKAITGMDFSPVNILLSHDPSHWRAQVAGKVKEIDLTLSGHTHGFQFGVEIPGFKWSPVQYVYNEWADLYSESKQFLYVNRGLGFIGYPGRVGILPEITLFTLT